MRNLKIALIGCLGFAFMAASVSASPGGARAKTEMFQKSSDHQVYAVFAACAVMEAKMHAPELPAAVAFVSDRSVIKLPVVNEISLLMRPGWRSEGSYKLSNHLFTIRRGPPLIV